MARFGPSRVERGTSGCSPQLMRPGWIWGGQGLRIDWRWKLAAPHGPQPIPLRSKPRAEECAGPHPSKQAIDLIELHPVTILEALTAGLAQASPVHEDTLVVGVTGLDEAKALVLMPAADRADAPSDHWVTDIHAPCLCLAQELDPDTRREAHGREESQGTLVHEDLLPAIVGLDEAKALPFCQKVAVPPRCRLPGGGSGGLPLTLPVAHVSLSALTLPLPLLPPAMEGFFSQTSVSMTLSPI